MKPQLYLNQGHGRGSFWLAFKSLKSKEQWTSALVRAVPVTAFSSLHKYCTTCADVGMERYHCFNFPSCIAPKKQEK